MAWLLLGEAPYQSGGGSCVSLQYGVLRARGAQQLDDAPSSRAQIRPGGHVGRRAVRRWVWCGTWPERPAAGAGAGAGGRQADRQGGQTGRVSSRSAASDDTATATTRRRRRRRHGAWRAGLALAGEVATATAAATRVVVGHAAARRRPPRVAHVCAGPSRARTVARARSRCRAAQGGGRPPATCGQDSSARGTGRGGPAFKVRCRQGRQRAASGGIRRRAATDWRCAG